MLHVRMADNTERRVQQLKDAFPAVPKRHWFNAVLELFLPVAAHFQVGYW